MTLRGEIRMARLGRSGGNDDPIPVVVVSNDGANAMAARGRFGYITVVPLSREVDSLWRFQALVPGDEAGLSGDMKAQAEQVFSVPIDDLSEWIGGVPPRRLVDIDEALRFHLAL